MTRGSVLTLTTVTGVTFGKETESNCKWQDNSFPAPAPRTGAHSEPLPNPFIRRQMGSSLPWYSFWPDGLPLVVLDLVVSSDRRTRIMSGPATNNIPVGAGPSWITRSIISSLQDTRWGTRPEELHMSLRKGNSLEEDRIVDKLSGLSIFENKNWRVI